MDGLRPRFPDRADLPSPEPSAEADGAIVILSGLLLRLATIPTKASCGSVR